MPSFTSIGAASSKTAASSYTVTLTGSASVGDLVVLCATAHGAAVDVPTTVTDSKGNTWSNNGDPNLCFGTSTEVLAIFFSKLTVALAVNDTVTINWKNSSGLAASQSANAMSVIDVTALANAVIDQTSSSSGSSTSATSLNVTTTAAVEALIGVIGVNGPSGDTYSATGGFTLTPATHTGTSGGSANTNATDNSETQSTSATGSFAASGTLGTSRGWVAAIATFKTAPAAGGTVLVPRRIVGSRVLARRPRFRRDVPLEAAPPVPLRISRRVPGLLLRRTRVPQFPLPPPAAPATPSFVEWWRKRFSPRGWTRRGRSLEPPWGLAVVSPTFVSWPARLRRMLWLARRSRPSVKPAMDVSVLQVQTRRRQALRRTAAGRAEVPKPVVPVVAPFIDWWKRRFTPRPSVCPLRPSALPIAEAPFLPSVVRGSRRPIPVIRLRVPPSALVAVAPRTYRISGVSRDCNSQVVPNATVKLYLTATDTVVQTTTSDASGQYSFTVADNSTHYYLVAYKPGAVDLAGTTVNTLTGQ
jgi:hypothetical protein